MEKDLYKQHYEAEKRGWWAVGRRNMIINFIHSLKGVPQTPDILDFGCGTGGMLDDLKKFASVYGCDTEDIAIELCKQRGLENITKLDGKTIPYENERFDVITAMDVLEHVEDDVFVMNELNRILKKGGYLMITVPAFMTLWTTRDERLHHFRRYKKKELVTRLKSADFEVVKCSYMHFFYFLPLLFVYKLKYFIKRKENVSDVKTDFSVVPKPINSTLIAALNTETFFLKFINFPFGVSLFCIARKKK